MDNASLDDLKSHLVSMRRGQSRGRMKPHKLLMILAVLDLFDAGRLQENQIHFDSGLIETFQDYFRAVAKDGDWLQPAPPFFHLRSSPFWHLQPKDGREQQYAVLKSSGGGTRRIVDNVAYAYFSDGAYSVLVDRAVREEVRQFILNTFFEPQDRQRLMSVVIAHRGLSQAKESMERYHAHERPESDHDARSLVFRRLILRVYDHRCAACGLRMVFPDLPSPVEAVHLVPWCESHDDSPQNGLALCRLHSWALEAGLIAPSLDLCWIVSTLLDARRDSERKLTSLAGLRLLLPQATIYYPKEEALAWRIARMAG